MGSTGLDVKASAGQQVDRQLTMGIWRSSGKRRKSHRSTGAATGERDGILRQGLKDLGRPRTPGNGMRKRPGN